MTDPNRAQRVGELAPWPKGKRRNNPRPPRPWESMDEFWSVLSVELSRFGAKKELIEYLECDRKLLWAWENRKKNPSQESVTKMGRWLRGKVGR